MPAQGQDRVPDRLAVECNDQNVWSSADEPSPHSVTPHAPVLVPPASFNSAQKTAPVEVAGPTLEAQTPVSSVDDSGDHSPISNISNVSNGPSSPEPNVHHQRTRSNDDSLGDPFPRLRILPNSTSSYLKPGYRFTGTQRSDKQEYEVTVDLQYVDMESSFLCGFLKIRGLTPEHPTLTTFFEGEMIGSKYSFITNNWGADQKTDFQHWARFPAWRPLQKDARRSNFNLKNWSRKENIWMRWKEHFLVPDHKIKNLAEASFEGFYYICFNQIEGTIQGTYFHASNIGFSTSS